MAAPSDGAVDDVEVASDGAAEDAEVAADVAVMPACSGLTIRPDTFDAGALTVEMGSGTQRIFSVTNATLSPTTGSLAARMTPPGTDFVVLAPIRAGSCVGVTLKATASCELVVGFAPTKVGVQTATLEVSDDGTLCGEAVLSGTGVMPPPLR